MPSKFLRYERRPPKNESEPFCDLVIPRGEYERFSPRLFGLDRLNTGTKSIHVVAGVFDLDGFTSFCSQPDPQISVPGFLDRFIEWLFSTLREETTLHADGGELELYATLPFYAKFLGDGVLLLWAVDYERIERFGTRFRRRSEVEVQGDVTGIVAVIYNTCGRYAREFYPPIAKKHLGAPKRLRCGVAQGSVCELAGGRDYIGPCINMASRLQKLGSLGLSVLQNGIDLEMSYSRTLSKALIRKRVVLRGAGEQIVYVSRNEFNRLPKKERDQFQDV